MLMKFWGDVTGDVHVGRFGALIGAFEHVSIWAVFGSQIGDSERVCSFGVNLVLYVTIVGRHFGLGSLRGG